MRFTHRACAFLGAGLVLVALSACSGSAPEGGPASGAASDVTDQPSSGRNIIYTAQPGDCFMTPDKAAKQVYEITQLDCDTPHESEVFHVHYLTDEKMPSPDSLNATADDICREAFSSYVGIADTESSLSLWWLTPTVDSWEQQGDRRITCAVEDENLTPLIGSVKDSRL